MVEQYARYTDEAHTMGSFIRPDGTATNGPLPPNSGDIAAEFYAFIAAGGGVDPYVAPAPEYKSLALTALEVSDTTALRCFKAGVPFPAEWQNYTSALRGIVKSGTGPLPDHPAYPAGT